MKITMNAETKKYLTLAVLPIAKQIIKDMKDDETDYAEMAARIATKSGYVIKVYESKAIIAGNCRVWNLFGESGTLDVWIDFTAHTSEGFVIGGCYLSDLWKADGENEDYIRNHMFIRNFKEAR